MNENQIEIIQAQKPSPKLPKILSLVLVVILIAVFIIFLGSKFFKSVLPTPSKNIVQPSVTPSPSPSSQPSPPSRVPVVKRDGREVNLEDERQQAIQSPEPIKSSPTAGSSPPLIPKSIKP